MDHMVEVRPQRSMLRWFIALLTVVVLVTPTVHTPTVYGADSGGEDVQERFKILKKDLLAHKKAKELRKLREDVKAAEKLYLDAENEDELRVEIVNLVGSLTKTKRNEQIVIMGLHGLGDLGDPRGAKYVRAKLRQPRVKESSDVLEAAVATAADVVEISLVAPLLKIVTKSKTYGVAADAIQSLGRYRDCEKKRVHILRTLVETVRKDRAGGISGGGGASGGARGGSGGTSTDPDQGPLPQARGGATSGRWTALSRVLPGAMNDLTGLDIASVDDWIELVRENRSSLASLFQAPAK